MLFGQNAPKHSADDFLFLDVMDGYNGTVFAYGQTGSGKTFTMMVRVCVRLCACLPLICVFTRVPI